MAGRCDGTTGGAVAMVQLAAHPSTSSTQQQPGERMNPIPKVREQLRGVVTSSDLIFAPQAVAIGPYHRRAATTTDGSHDPFPWTEKQKTEAVEFVKELLRQDGGAADGLDDVVSGLVEHVIACYDTPNPPSIRVDTGMLLRDGCFLLRFFIPLMPADARMEEVTEPKDNTMIRDILYLRENQMPLPVLDQMMQHITSQSPGGPKSAFTWIAKATRDVLQQQYYISKGTKTVLSDECRSSSSDILHLMYYCLRRQQQPPEPPAGLVTSSSFRFWSWGRRQPHQAGTGIHARLPGPGPQQTATGSSFSCCCFWRRRRRQQQEEPRRRPLVTGRWRRATDYARHGDVKFRCRDFDSGQQEWSILDISYDNDRGRLYIPFLRVSSSTWTMLRNLMAMEEQEMEERPVTAYCLLMSQLACTPEDVQLLQRAKILDHFLGSDDRAAQGFADLCDGVALDIDDHRRNYLKPVWHAMEERCAKSVNHFNGLFRDKYCASTFYRCVYLVTFILFVCQVSQAIFAALPYLK